MQLLYLDKKSAYAQSKDWIMRNCILLRSQRVDLQVQVTFTVVLVLVGTVGERRRQSAHLCPEVAMRRPVGRIGHIHHEVHQPHYLHDDLQ